MTKETAVQEFNWWVNNHINDLLDGTLGYDEFKQRMEASFVEFKAMEKEQILEAYREGRTDQHSGIEKFHNRSSSMYYNQTFGS